MPPARPVSENDPNTRRKSRSPSRPVRARREKLFKRINALPTVYEILSGKATAKPKANKKPPAVVQVRLAPRLASPEKPSHVVFRAFLLAAGVPNALPLLRSLPRKSKPWGAR
jgi:hypothetical protein